MSWLIYLPHAARRRKEVPDRMGGREAEGASLENWITETFRGFESLPIRQLARLAQLAEALALNSRQFRFESWYRHHRGVEQPGSASALEAEGREFESRRPDQFSIIGPS